MTLEYTYYVQDALKLEALLVSQQMTGVANYFEREVKRRAFVVQRWDFRETEKREIENEAKRKAGVSAIYELRHEKTCPGFPTRSDTNQAAQSQKMARGLKFWI